MLKLQYAQKLRHTNIVEVKENFWSHKSCAFITVQELCHYGSLGFQIQERLDTHKDEFNRDLREPFPEKLVRICMVHLAQALESVHKRGFVHLEVNP